MKQSLFLLVVMSACLFNVPKVQARENVTDWYIQDFRAEFEIREDSIMTVTERITADCGECVGKHGIFRVVPTAVQTPGGDIETPVTLLSITDFAGRPHKFEETRNTSDDTITWKIGDPDKTVTGINEYQIVYVVRNVIRDQGEFHEWYWNVVGNFWDLPIDTFVGTVHFPDGVTQTTTELNLYSGALGTTSNEIAAARWDNDHTLVVKSTRGLALREGITVSASFPTTIFTPYQFSWWELYGPYLWFLIPVVMGIYLYRMWRRYGDDPAWDKPVIAEYEIPAGLNALTAGVLLSNGGLKSEYITAALIELAVKGVVTIHQTTEKILFFESKDFVLERHIPTDFIATPEQQLLLDTVFATGNSVKLKDLKHKFHPVLGPLTKRIKDSLIQAKLIERSGFTYQNIFVGIGIVGLLVSFTFLAGLHWVAIVAIILTWLLFVGFGIVMPKRTNLGVETYAKLKGLKLYMETAEKYRQQFHEKEGVFETLLPIAILFGMTKEWIKKMEEMYGALYFKNYHPAWFVGSFDTGFDASSFASQMESVSSSIASNMGTSSGSSGGGSSGGGGGGGGGGGW